MFFLIILSTIMFFFCLYLYIEIKKLKTKISDLEIETKIILERKIFEQKEDLISIENISTPTSSTNKKEKITKEIKNEESFEENMDTFAKKEPYIAMAPNNFEENNKPKFSLPTSQYIKGDTEDKKKNITQKENTKPKYSLPTSEYVREDLVKGNIKNTPKENIRPKYSPPIEEIPRNESISKKIEDESINSKNLDVLEKVKEISIKPKKEEAMKVIQEPPIMPNVTLTDNFNPSDFVKNDTNIIQSAPVSESKSESIKTEKVTTDYLQELSTHLKEELAPQTIELTGYEKIQEEQAIISYKELLSLKEKLKNQDKQDEQFLETLKELRKLLD